VVEKQAGWLRCRPPACQGENSLSNSKAETKNILSNLKAATKNQVSNLKAKTQNPFQI
jgi:hypothetical protein